ncbi:MAG TPA: isocitrate/isopropylmalate family dehydrogenase [Holophaga sp.]|nr:isocitrate/isopropylmalate family dehydrogenase [Holophaga sp.]
MPLFQVAVIAGDGIGPEVMAEALPLLAWARDRGRPLAWTLFPHGADHCLATGETLSQVTFEHLRDHFDALLFGAVGDPRIPDQRHAEAILLRLRKDLALGVNLRPCLPLADHLVPLKGVGARDIHIEVFRENTEGPYVLAGETAPGRATDLALHTEAAVRPLLEAAFHRAQAQGRPLHLAHKANVLKHGHGLWLRMFQELKQAYPEVEATPIHADALLCALIQRPQAFGVIAGDNYVGDLISDLLAAFQGGMGMAPSLSYAPHPAGRCRALAEPVHGSAPDLAGKDLANPAGIFLSTALLFRFAGWETEALAVEKAVQQALEAGEGTPDVKGTLGCRAFSAALRARLH